MIRNSKILYCRTLLVLLLLSINIIENVICKDWWEGGNFYQIYPRSFKDSNGDGVGDLNGITSKMHYLKEIGMTGVWLSPIFKSPMADFGYDISDYTQVHDEYGTLEDFDRLVKKCRELDIKLILDFVPNHTSDEHEWFIKSAIRDPEYEDFYIWHKGVWNATTSKYDPPNNWVSVFRFSAWQWNTQREEFYLHQFAVKQPDLNYRNPKVVEAMKNVLRLWLHRGVSGFRIDAVPYLFEVEADVNGNYPDEPLSGNCDDPDSPCYTVHSLTQNLDETFDMAYQWRAVMDEYKQEYGGETKIIMTEAYTSFENTIRFYGDGIQNGSHIPFNFELINYMRNDTTAVEYKNRVDSWLNAMPDGVQANWVMGNHDNKRLASRFGKNRADLLNMMLQTLPGIGVTYNGEELALTDVYIPWSETVDPQACNTNETVFNDYSRDPARTPFQWDATPFSGFTTGDKTWLPVAADYRTNNVQIQMQSPFSHLKIFKILTSLRKGDAFQYGDYESYANDELFIIKRSIANGETYIILLNFSTTTKSSIQLTKLFPNLSSRLEIILTSLQSGYVYGNIINTNDAVAYAEVGTIFVAV